MHSELFDFCPRSFLIPKDIESLKSYMVKYKNKTFICKPSDGAEGCGISLVNKFKDLPSHVLNGDDYVVQ